MGLAMFPENNSIWSQSPTMEEIHKEMEVRLSGRIGAGAGPSKIEA